MDCSCIAIVPLSAALLLTGPAMATPGDPCIRSTQEIDCDSGEFCRWPDRACNNQVEGVCTTIPAECPDLDDPVCGCDFRTYRNGCEADAATVPIFRMGECPQVCGTIAGISCDTPGQVCYYRPEGTCLVFDASGLCDFPPESCDDTCAPVCACDFRTTYRNECEAKRVGEAAWTRGACRTDSIVANVRFLTATLLAWQGLEDALSYNVYLEATDGGPPLDGGDCLVAGLEAPSADLSRVPAGGELWFYQLSGNFPDGEGPLEEFGADCDPLLPAVPCN